MHLLRLKKPRWHLTLFSMKADPTLSPRQARQESVVVQGRAKLGFTWESHIFADCLSSLCYNFFNCSSYPDPKLTSLIQRQWHSCRQVQSLSEHSAITQRGARLLTENESWRQWSAHNVHSLWRQLLAGELLYCPLPKHPYRGCVSACVCVRSCPATLSAPFQNDFFVISASPFSEGCTEAFLKRRDRVCLDGNESVPPKQDVETLRCSSRNIPAQSGPFVRHR